MTKTSARLHVAAAFEELAQKIVQEIAVLPQFEDLFQPGCPGRRYLFWRFKFVKSDCPKEAVH